MHVNVDSFENTVSTIFHLNEDQCHANTEQELKGFAHTYFYTTSYQRSRFHYFCLIVTVVQSTKLLIGKYKPDSLKLPDTH